jgi:hypothetical protein
MRLVSWKYRNAIAVCVMTIALGQIGAAQESQQAEQKARPPAPAVAPPIAKPMVLIPALRNIQVEITIIDQVGSEPPLKKTISLIAADRGSGSIRSNVTIAVPRQPPGPDPKNYVFEELPLNVDIRPEVTEDKNRIRARLILNYETSYASKTSGMPAVKSVLTVDQHVMLDNGKPMVVSQSADAATDRKVSVELKATILP